MHRTGIVVLLAVAVTGQKPDPPIKPEDAAVYAAGVAKGRAEAEAELSKGEASIYYEGGCATLEIEGIDRKTGLPLGGFGGMISWEVSGRIDGHNARIMEYIREHGSPPNSYKRWEEELFDIAGYFAKQERAGTTIRLAPETSPIRSPDGRLTIRAEFRRPRSRIPEWRIWHTFSSPGRAPWTHAVSYKRAGESELCWGPAGSHLAFFRWTEDGRVTYAVLDTRDSSSGWLRRVHDWQ